MGVSLEPIVFIARSGPNYKDHNDMNNNEYDTVATIVKIDEKTVKICGAVSAIKEGMTTKTVRELLSKLKALGFTKIVWDRKKKDLKKIEIKL